MKNKTILISEDTYLSIYNYGVRKHGNRDLTYWEKEDIKKALASQHKNENGLLSYDGIGIVPLRETIKYLKSQGLPYQLGEKIKAIKVG